jgi:hypothetical protein
LVLFNVSQYKPLALAAFRKLPPPEAIKVLKDCVTLSFRFNVISRYILCEVERQNSGQDLSWNTSNATIEHILPDHLDEEWGEIFSEDEHARFVERLGNYALLKKGKNKDIGQELFDAKKEVFVTSQYQ